MKELIATRDLAEIRDDLTFAIVDADAVSSVLWKVASMKGTSVVTCS